MAWEKLDYQPEFADEPTIGDKAMHNIAMTARAGYSGMAAPLDIASIPQRVGEAGATWLYNQFADKPTPYTSNAIDWTGNVQEAFDKATGGIGKPQTSGERIYSAGVSGLTGSGALGGVANFANAAPKVVNALGLGSKANIASAIGSGAAAQSVAEVTDNPLLQMGAGMIGAGAPQLLAGGVQGIKNALKPDTGKILESTDIKPLAEAKYNDAARAGGLYNPIVGKAYLKGLKKIASQTSEGAATSGKDAINGLIQRYESIGMGSQPLTLQAIQDMDEGLGGLITASLKDGKSTPDTRDLMQAQTWLRGLVEKAPDRFVLGGKQGVTALKDARKLYSASMKQRDIETLIQRAEMTDNPASALKNGFKNIVTNPKKSRGYTKEEIDLMKRATKSDIGLEGLRSVGSRLVGIIGVGTGNPVAGLASSAISMGARKALTDIQMNKANDVSRAITRGITGQPKQTLESIPMNYRALSSSSKSTTASTIAGSPEDLNPQVQPKKQWQKLDYTPTFEETPQPVNIQEAPQGNAGNDILTPQASLTQQNEGLRLSSYNDPVAGRDVGYGFSMSSKVAGKAWKEAGIQKSFKDVYQGKTPITPEEAQSLYQVSHRYATDDARAVYKNFDSLPPHKQEVLVDLAYQHGRPSLISNWKQFNALVNKGDFTRAVLSLKNSDYAVKYQDRAQKIAKALSS